MRRTDRTESGPQAGRRALPDRGVFGDEDPGSGGADAYLFQGDTVFVEFYRAQEGAYELQTAELTLEGQPEEEE